MFGRMKTISAHRVGFTLVEMLVVVAILALLISMLIPSLQGAIEQARIVNCGNILTHIGNAMQHYVSDNQDHMPPYGWVDPDIKNIDNRPPQDGDPNSGWWFYNWQNLLGTYMGLGDCMPHRGLGNMTNCQNAYLGLFPAYQCPVGASLGKNASPWGGAIVCSYMESVPQNLTGVAWPAAINYLPALKNPTQSSLLVERWRCYQASSNANCGAVPYNTHFRIGNKGAMGIGRNILWADWHVSFWHCVDGPDIVNPNGYWSCGGDQIPCSTIKRGNETGYTWWLDNDHEYIDWNPNLPSAG